MLPEQQDHRVFKDQQEMTEQLVHLAYREIKDHRVFKDLKVM